MGDTNYSRQEGTHLYAVLCSEALKRKLKPDEAVSLADASPSLDALGPLLTALCPDVTAVEITHVAAMLAARAEAVGAFPPPSSLPSLQGGLEGLVGELTAMQKLREVFWGIRCTVTGGCLTQKRCFPSRARMSEQWMLLRRRATRLHPLQPSLVSSTPSLRLAYNSLWTPLQARRCRRASRQTWTQVPRC